MKIKSSSCQVSRGLWRLWSCAILGTYRKCPGGTAAKDLHQVIEGQMRMMSEPTCIDVLGVNYIIVVPKGDVVLKV
jgi:hypothetical protein